MANANSDGVIDPAHHTFIIPTKQVKDVSHIKDWEASEAYADVMGCIVMLNKSVEDKKLSIAYEKSEVIVKLTDMLTRMSGWIDEIPPIDQPQRFGNQAYRQFHGKLTDCTDSLLEACLDQKYHSAVPELSVYLCDSFGNSTRIDYGTGHELAFVAMLCCLFKLGALNGERDGVATVFSVFNTYLELCRKLQQIYCMEPAGSHGVWSLDDFQFIPFIWGSSQLMNHKRLTPAKFPEEDYYQGFYKDYMFMSCIRYICSVKTGPFSEHSNQLWNISGVPLWSKVNSGLIKMYKAEVLSKFPVIQHFYFGSILTLEKASK